MHDYMYSRVNLFRGKIRTSERLYLKLHCIVLKNVISTHCLKLQATMNLFPPPLETHL